MVAIIWAGYTQVRRQTFVTGLVLMHAALRCMVKVWLSPSLMVLLEVRNVVDPTVSAASQCTTGTANEIANKTKRSRFACFHVQEESGCSGSPGTTANCWRETLSRQKVQELRFLFHNYP